MSITIVTPLRAALGATLLALAGSAVPLNAQDPADAVEALRVRVERLRADGFIETAGDTIAAGAIAEFYEATGFGPVWREASRAAVVIAAAAAMATEGLNPIDYHARPLRAFASVRPRSPADTAALDLLLTSALYRIAHDLRSGRADRSLVDATWRVESGAPPVDAAVLAGLATSTDLAAAIDSLRPSHPIQAGMRDALAHYRAIRDTGGWPQLPDGPTMRRDSAAGPIELLHRRLAIEGYTAPLEGDGPPVFDAALESGVIAFQHTHGLNEDGAVGPATRAELNVTVDQRIDALRVNMERARWVLPGLADRLVAVNIAGQKVYYVEDGEVIFESRAIVGTSYTRTPVFADTMRYIVINPTWTVPRSISREVLAGIRSDPDYLTTRQIVVIDGAENRVDPATIDFAGYTAATFPWVFRQLPGPLNSLGRIKFMFPNQYNVYLHDTPSRDLFEREVRTFSHGCIRVEDPFRLAELVLAGQDGGDQASLMRMVASDRTATVQLERPIPVLILYWTASADLHGELHFYRDIYGRDGAVLSALAASASR
jgi:murein L,D-transpeptidase YcbB/YkuD